MLIIVHNLLTDNMTLRRLRMFENRVLRGVFGPERDEVKVKGKVASRGFFNTTASLAGLLYSCPNKFQHSSPEAPRIIHMRETSTSEGGNYSPRFC
jgi:hypothetical protein